MISSNFRVARFSAILGVIACLLIAFGIRLASAQQQRPTTQALTSDELIDLLRANPDANDSLKTLAAKRLQVSPEDISDDDLFSRIRQDENLRALLTEAARAQGLVPEVPAAVDHPVSARRTSAPVKPRPETVPQPGAQIVAESNPYDDLPSLQDLYRQIRPQGITLPRFGLSIFQAGTDSADSLPADLPVGPDYVLGPGDGVNIDMWGGVSQRVTRTVDREGRIALPEAGTIVVAGQTLAKAQENILRALEPQYRNLSIDVSLTRLRSVRVYVVGDVQRPGAYDISSLSTPLNALYPAGGPMATGSLRSVRHYRGKELISQVDLYDLLLKGVRADVARLEPGDTVLVPPVGPQVSVAGMVKRPAIYEIKDEKTLSDVIDLAGGVLVSASLREITIDRVDAHQRHTTLSPKMPPGNDLESIKAALRAFEIQDGDQVTLGPILPYTEQAVYLQGHVFRPGRYPYRSGMRIADLVRSYQDTLPEPADHAELIRLAPPDYRPYTIEFALSEALRGGGSMELQPFDTVRIFGRYEIDAPKVAIYGEVLRAGEYPLSEDMTAGGLIRMAGGFKRSANPHAVDIASYAVVNGAKVEVSHRTIDAADPSAGVPGSDAKLKPGDIVSVRQLTGWGDIGGSAVVRGEVALPGTYGIAKGEKLSSLIKRAGGFRDTAYPAAAVLERPEIRSLAEKGRDELVKRIESASSILRIAPGTAGQEQTVLMQAMQQQQQHILSTLRSQPVSGRLVIQINLNVAEWANTAADIEIRAGDTLTIPQRSDFVLVSGQVYSPAAISYVPGMSAAAYLSAAGGTTDTANKNAIFVVRANGSVMPLKGNSWFRGSPLRTVLAPGDTLVVPERILGGYSFWRGLLEFAQVTSGLAIAARVATTL